MFFDPISVIQLLPETSNTCFAAACNALLFHSLRGMITKDDLSPVVRKPINANPLLKVNQHISTRLLKMFLTAAFKLKVKKSLNQN